MTVDLSLRAQFYNIIDKTTAATPITEKDIAQRMGLTSVAKLREKVIAPLRREGFPIATGGKGVFLARRAEELQETIEHLRSRRDSYWALIKGVELAMARLRVGYNPLELQERLL